MGAVGAVVTRFAPSPTGRGHIGGIRTALYNWLYARASGGRFLLRIEDTDRERSRPVYERDIIEGLQWLGLDWDGTPVRQSERLARHRERLEQLLDAGKAYRCVCTSDRLDALRSQQMSSGRKPGYDGHCRTAGIERGDGRAHVVRLLTPVEGAVTVHDSLRGGVTVANHELDDMILARSDGSPTYQLSAVADDIDAAVSHVIRGDDHLNNTLRQAHLYSALNETPPSYTHLPMILDENGRRYSKRSAGAGLETWRRRGVCADALLNYLLRLGWSHGDKEFFTRPEMIEMFDLAGLNRSACSFNPGKLDWLNRRHIQTLAPARLRDCATDCLAYLRREANPSDTANSSAALEAADSNTEVEATSGGGVAVDSTEAIEVAGGGAGVADSSQAIEAGSGGSGVAVPSAGLSAVPEMPLHPGLRAFKADELTQALNDDILAAARAKATDLIDLMNLATPLLSRTSLDLTGESAGTEHELAQYTQADSRSRVQLAIEMLEPISDWSAEALPAGIKSLCKQHGLKMPQLAQPLRFALLGELSRLGLSDILRALGRDEALTRLRAFMHNTQP